MLLFALLSQSSGFLFTFRSASFENPKDFSIFAKMKVRVKTSFIEQMSPKKDRRGGLLYLIIVILAILLLASALFVLLQG
jgi:hypothetical protein